MRQRGSHIGLHACRMTLCSDPSPFWIRCATRPCPSCTKQLGLFYSGLLGHHLGCYPSATCRCGWPTKILPSSHLHACLAPCRCKTLLKLQKPSWSSACRVQAWPWPSKHHPPLRLATGPSSFPPPHLRTCTSSVPYTSLQGSHLAQGSLLLYGLPRWMLPYHATLRLASVDNPKKHAAELHGYI